ncbi:hypothetical protein [Paraburkholderia tagetis]|uniref:Uncharacterized protein n=1 Tax=Paraburkholderia tagetis TaxID=2913261 RepID=A0A9X1UP70_9BURK|nr:hypothetical protein [Paraburkholderia tagetis]MCG5079064.1 hypothetical protein [Paraburkholderia tagetis]
MSMKLMGIVVGMFALVIAMIGVIGHYRRERRRAELLRNLDHDGRCSWGRRRH